MKFAKTDRGSQEAVFTQTFRDEFAPLSVLTTNMMQTRQAGSLPTVDIQREIRHPLLDVPLIQSPHCAERRSKHQN